MNRFAFNLAWLSLAALCVPSLMGCPFPICREVQTRVALEDFEDVCGDMPCGWDVDSGSASSAPTIHEALLGLRVDADSRVHRDVNWAGSSTSDSGPASLRLFAQCEESASLLVALTIQPAMDPGTSFPPAERRVVVRFAPSEINGELFETLEDSLGSSGRVLLIEIATEGGACTIDDLELMRSITVC